MRPSSVLEGRDARGRFHFPRSGPAFEVAHRYPILGGNFEIALCYEQTLFGVRENFQHPDSTIFTLCDCGTGSRVCDAPDVGTFLSGDLARCYVYYERGYPPRGPGAFMLCVGVFSDNIIKVDFAWPGIGNTGVIHQGSSEDRLFNVKCTMNRATRCYGHRVGSSCAIVGFDPNNYWDANWANFDWVQIEDFQARFSQSTQDDVLRNRLMTWFQNDLNLGFNGATRMDQVNSPRRNAGLADSFNSVIEQWSREFFANDLDSAPKVADLTGKLRRSGVTINGEYVLLGAQILMNITFLEMNPTQPGVAPILPHRVYPQVRMRCRWDLGIRVDEAAFNAAGHEIVFDWLEESDRPPPISLQVQNRNGLDHDSFPVVVNDADRIDWSYLGLPVNPSTHIQWWGEQNFLSDPPSQTLGTDCNIINVLFAASDGVPALASHYGNDPGDRHKVFTGRVICRFGF